MKLNTRSRLKIRSITTGTSATALTEDEFILISDAAGNFTLSLPPAASCVNKVMLIKKTNLSANIILIDGNGAETIDGATIFYLYMQNELVEIVSTGTAWNVINHPATNWVTFTPTSNWTTNVSFTGYRRRVGDSIELQYNASFSGAPTTTSLLFDIPNGDSIDTNKITYALAGLIPSLGKGLIYDDSAGVSYQADAVYYSATQIAVYYGLVSVARVVDTAVGNSNPIPIGNNDKIQIRAILPIIGF